MTSKGQTSVVGANLSSRGNVKQKKVCPSDGGLFSDGDQRGVSHGHSMALAMASDMALANLGHGYGHGHGHGMATAMAMAMATIHPPYGDRSEGKIGGKFGSVVSIFNCILLEFKHLYNSGTSLKGNSSS